MMAVYEIPTIDHNDYVTCYGFDPNETVVAYMVDAVAKTAVTISISNNVVQVNQVGVDDVRAVLFVYGLM